MNFLIIGAGAIGCLVGGKLALSGADVTLAGRPAFAAAVAERGLQLEDEAGVHIIDTVRVTGSIEEAVGAAPPFDMAVMTVKSYDTAAAVADCVAALDTSHQPLPHFLSLQNGVGNEATIAHITGAERSSPHSVIAGTIITPVSAPAPATIRVDRPRYGLGLGCRPSQEPLCAQLAETLSTAGFDVHCYADARGMKWTKLLLNMVGNASCAILDAPPEQVFAQDAMVDLEISAWREALHVMKLADITPQNVGSYPFRVLAPAIRHAPIPLLRAALRRQIGAARGGKMPSLYLDLVSGKGKSEVGWLNGAVVEMGQKLGVKTPVNACLTNTLLSLVADPALRPSWKDGYARLATACQQRAAE
jgi:2-dehydropantoate 2-reductase